MSWGDSAYRQMPEITAMISQVVSLSVASADSGGGDLCPADSHSDPAPLLIALSTLMLDHLRDGLWARRGVSPDPVAPSFAVTVPPAGGHRMFLVRGHARHQPAQQAAEWRHPAIGEASCTPVSVLPRVGRAWLFAPARRGWAASPARINTK